MKRALAKRYIILSCLALPLLLLARVNGGQAALSTGGSFPKVSPGAGRTIGLLRNDPGAYAGYALFAPISSTTTYLIDMAGNLVHSWPSSYPAGNVVYLLENGNLLHTCTTFSGPGGSGGRLEEIDWDGFITWELDVTALSYLSHHDVSGCLTEIP